MHKIMVMTIFNQRVLLAETLGFIAAAPEHRYQQLRAVSNTSASDTAMVLSCHASAFSLESRCEPIRRLTHAEHREPVRANGEHTVFTSDDAIIAPDWRRELFDASQRSHGLNIGEARLIAHGERILFVTEAQPPVWLSHASGGRQACVSARR